jgi:hypothetical protein
MSSWFGRHVSGVAIGLALTEGIPSPCAAQTDDERSGARAAAEAGIAAYNANRFSEAFDLLTRAESLIHAPTHLLYMARAADKLGHLVQAHEIYVKISREQLNAVAPHAFVEAQHSAQQEQLAIEKRIPHLTINIAGAPLADIKVTIDSRSLPNALLGVPFPEDPGNHVLLATASQEKRSDEVKVVLAEGKREQVTLSVHASGPASVTLAVPLSATRDNGAGEALSNPAPPGETMSLNQRTGGSSNGKKTPVLAWASLGVAAVGAGFGTVFLLQRGSKNSDADKAFNDCNARVCTFAERDHINSLYQSAAHAGTLSLVSYGVGAAAISTGLVLLFRGNSKTSSAAGSLHLAPYVGIGHAGATLRF